MFHYFRQEDFLGIELEKKPRKFIIPYELKELIKILKEGHDFETNEMFCQFLRDNLADIEELILEASKDGGPLYQLSIIENIKKATTRPWYLIDLMEDILLNVFSAIFIPLSFFMKVKKITEDYLVGEADFLTKNQYDEAFKDELEENLSSICFVKNN